MKRYDCPTCRRHANVMRMGFTPRHETDSYLAHECSGHDPNEPEWDPHGPPATPPPDIPTPQELLAASPDYSATIAEDLSMIVGRLRMNPRSPVALRRVVFIVDAAMRAKGSTDPARKGHA